MVNQETIDIKNFAGIDNLYLEVKPVNILIGPQGVGKSVVVKLLYFFKGIVNDAVERIETTDQVSFIKESVQNKFKKIFDKSSFNTKQPFQITYTSIEGEIFIVEGDGFDEFNVFFSEGFLNLLEELFKVKREFGKEKLVDKDIAEYYFQAEQLKSLRREIVKKTYQKSYLPQLFIPAGRSFFSTLHSNIYSIISNESSIDYFLREFGQLYQIISDFQTTINEDSSCDRLIEDVIGGKFIRDDNRKDYILHKDNRKVELKNVSSGQQEALPLLMILRAIYDKKLNTSGCILYIEEPEAHLFPTAQKAIVELLAKVYNSNSTNIQIFITTHSPYILSSFNNLIYAGNIANKNTEKRKEVGKVITEEQFLSCDAVGAYALTKTALIDLMDEENNIINATVLDEVSNDIGREFDQLLDIEFD
ncbi:AAA family ATPase [Myroides phaeus]|uniref:Predicted ATPase n=1 Tax=Myroides phaeus TaxID=702745 RepID=A0A1G8DKD0_9FLAO|nr:ATP-binding protein [Myroides phaeus]SDH58115.1 Predicted ATPase [Myroides phaeus]